MFTLYHGNNSFLSLREAKARFKQLKEEHPTFTSSLINADQTEAEEIVSNYDTGDMFSDGKILFIKRILKNRSKEELLSYIAERVNKEDSALFVILWEEQKVASNTKYYKMLNSTQYSYDSLNKRDFISWATNELKEEGFKLDNRLINAISESANFDSERFCNILDKLKLLENQKISLADITEVSTDTYEHEIWALIDSINRNNKIESFNIIDRMFEQKVEPLYILSMIVRNLRQLIQIKYLLSTNLDKNSIGARLKIHPYPLTALIKNAEVSDFNRLSVIYKKLYDRDYEIKIGNIEPEIGLTLMLTLIHN
jgi:DNA polymerase-3 subunit delta